MATTFRYDIATAVKTFLDSFKASNPTLLAETFRARPESCASFPYAYVDLRQELGHWPGNGILERRISTGFVVVDQLTNNDEVMVRMDVLVDGLVEALAALNGRMTIDSIFSDYSVTDTAEVQGAEEFQAVRFGFPEFLRPEGRQ